MQKQLTVFVSCVIRDQHILMTQRDEIECPEAHLKWELPGGKVDFGETPEEAIVREVYEETGVRVKVNHLLPLTYVNYWDYAWGRQQTLVFAFHCDFIKEEKLNKQDHHVARSEWVELKK